LNLLLLVNFLNKETIKYGPKPKIMKFISRLPSHKQILWLCFIPWLIFILLYEFLLIKIPASDIAYKFGIFFSRIGYSIVAASIFYFISQYLGVYTPRQKRRIKILSFVHRQSRIIDEVLGHLKININYEWGDIKDSVRFKEALTKIKVDDPIDNFIGWYPYLFYMKTQLLEVIRSISFYNEYLDKDFFHELLIIEQNLTSRFTFSGFKVLVNEDLSFADIDLQEILIHNQHLQEICKDERRKYKKRFDADGKQYRKTYYGQ
jgi:hypothetical protein